MRTKLGMTVMVGLLALALCAGTAWAESPQRGVVAPWGTDRTLIDYASGGGGGIRSVGPGLQAAADHIVGQQCTNGGWGWPHDDCTVTYNNITAPIALGLLQAYEMTADAAHLTSATDGGDYDLTSQYTNGEARFGTLTPHFLWKLTAATGDSTYSDFAAIDFFDELTASTYGPSDYDTAGWIAAVETGRTGTWINLRPWEFQTLGLTADAIGNTGQKALFNQAVLDGLNTLDNTNPGSVYSDLIGLAGGVRGLALNETTTFTAIVSPNHSGINGISTLEALADKLVSYQNADGSWYWHSNLSSPAADDKDTQTTAYAVMALIAAQDAGCGPYDDEIADGRDWLWSMQDTDGGFFSYPGGTHNTEVEGEVLTAMSCPSEVWVDDDYCLACNNDGHAWGYDAFDNIQDGINAVCGSTVNVAAGTYEEQVEIDKDNLTLQGAGSGSTTIQSPDTLTKFFATSANNYPIIYVHDTTGVTIRDLKVDGLGKGNANYRFMGIAFSSAGGDVTDCVVTAVRDEPLSGAQHGNAIYAWCDTGGPYTINVTGTTVDDYQKNGITFNGSTVIANASGCTVTGAGPLGPGPPAMPAQNGIQFGWGAGGTIEDCTISNHLYTDGWASAGVLLYGGTTVDMTGNTVLDNNPGVYGQDTNGSFDDGLISNQHVDSWDALYAINSGAKRGSGDDGKALPLPAPFEEDAKLPDMDRAARTFTLYNSTFIGHDLTDSWGVYIKAAADTMTASMTCCRVQDWDWGVYARELAGTVSMTANDNNIESNVSYGFYTDAAGVQNAEDNWWGNASGPTHTGNPGGGGDAVSDNVDYDPWLITPL
ncbi:MAG: right-handed parallel beta-helix repeat-containing protein, partial [Planctomycetota bacterium]